MDSKSSGSGIGLSTILFVVFLVLKLCNVIDWSWWWVTSPLWISFGLWVIGVIVYATILYVKNRKFRKNYGDKLTFNRKRWR